MKKIIFIITVTFISVFPFGKNSYGQNNISPSIEMMAQNLDQSKMNKKDCVMMKNGKLLMMKDGKTIDMPAEVKLNDGSIVYKNGTVKLSDGTSKAIKNGDSIDMDGKWERMEKAVIKN